MGETFTLRMACCAAAGATIHITLHYFKLLTIGAGYGGSEELFVVLHEESRMDVVTKLKVIPSVHVGS